MFMRKIIFNFKSSSKYSNLSTRFLGKNAYNTGALPRYELRQYCTHFLPKNARCKTIN